MSPDAPVPDPAPPRASPWPVPDHWRCIDFISDLHLCEALPRTAAACASYLASTPADAVLILGDLFELWVGDDLRTRPFEADWLATMRRASARTSLHVMVGNRDFLLGSAALADAGASALTDPTLLQAFGRRYLLTHGDALCLGDVDYQAFRRLVRGTAWQAAFLARPLIERLAIAAEIRGRSEARRRFDGDMQADIDADEARRWLDAAGAFELIHGHTHRPSGPGDTLNGVPRTVLSDWDLDDPARPRASVLRLKQDGLCRLPLEQAMMPT